MDALLLPVAEITRLTGAHASTVRRWKRGRLPRVIERCLALLQLGELGSLSPIWSGWRIRGELLYSPEGDRFTPGDVRASRVDREQVRELRRQLTAATETILSAQERRERVTALAALENALAAAAAASMHLAADLTDGERDQLFEALDSTRAARARAQESPIAAGGDARISDRTARGDRARAPGGRARAREPSG